MTEIGVVISLVVAAGACAGRPPIVEDSFAATSEPAAVALAESLIETAGGARAWSEAREIGWLQVTARDGAVVEVEEMVWDRAGDRFRHVHLAPSGIVTVVTGQRSGHRGDAYRVMPSGCLLQLPHDDRSRVIAASAALVRDQSFVLGLPFTLRSQGVELSLAGERVEPTVVSRDRSVARYDVLRVRRQGSDEVIDLVVGRASRRPVLIERRRGDEKPVGMRLERWRPTGGVELATWRADVAGAAGARVPLSLPETPHYRNRVVIDRAPIPARGTAVLVSSVEVFPDVDERLFSPRRP